MSDINKVGPKNEIPSETRFQKFIKPIDRKITQIGKLISKKGAEDLEASGNIGPTKKVKGSYGDYPTTKTEKSISTVVAKDKVLQQKPQSIHQRLEVDDTQIQKEIEESMNRGQRGSGEIFADIDKAHIFTPMQIYTLSDELNRLHNDTKMSLQGLKEGDEVMLDEVSKHLVDIGAKRDLLDKIMDQKGMRKNMF